MKYISTAICTILAIVAICFTCGCGGVPDGPPAVDAGAIRQDGHLLPMCPISTDSFIGLLKCQGQQRCDTYLNGKGDKAWNWKTCACTDQGKWKTSWFVTTGKPCGEWSGLMKWGKTCSLWLGDCFTPP